ncbi:hydroxypyruvate isomerase family protein [Egibacter rhizosphaerae]|uniref:hydroxypyruvate isomerase family protein n=1 Tax=Egibacter rhizosphaerae TaxID=1670831 RepID=UPI00197A8FDA|nr:TIM barrel protein [Egibacter rhizosphaerae]
MPDGASISHPSTHPNISTLFTELPFEHRVGAAAEAGFDEVEVWWPFDRPDPGDRAVDTFVTRCREEGVGLAALNLDGGDLTAGERGLVSLPGEESRFRANLPVAVELAERLGCRVLHALYGNRVLGVDPAAQDEIATERLTLAARAAERIGARVVVESLNPTDNPHYPLRTATDVCTVLDRVAAATGARLAWLCDLYHVQRGEGDLITTIRRHADRIGHVQVADAPGRGEPGTGEIAFERVLPELTRAGYEGRIGLEYRPSTTTEEGLAWLRQRGLAPAVSGVPHDEQEEP